MIRQLWNDITTRAAGMVDAQAAPDTPPPGTLGAFMRWCIAGAGTTIGLAAGANAIGGVIEVLMMVILGKIIDAATVTDACRYWCDQWPLLISGLVLMLVLRPLVAGVAGLMQSVALGPNLSNLILSRLHRHTIGQPVTFFDDDFAGRIAQKQMQTARAMTDIVTELVNVGAIAISSVVATLVMVGALDLWLMLVLFIWLAAYVAFLRFFLPRIRQRSAARASARAMVTGQVVDTITNIKTVKLFAQADHEDSAAIEAMDQFRDKGIHWAKMAVLFRYSLIFLAGCLPVGLIGAALVGWGQGTLSPGDIAAVGALAIRLANMTGWVSWTMLAMYGNIGEVEDGMRTLSPAHALQDMPNARDIAQITPSVQFDTVSFAYGRQVGGVSDINLTIAPGEKIGLVGASGAGKSTLTALLLRLYDTESGRVVVGGHDVRNFTQESLRRQISMVTQETAMFNRSARENVIYGRPNATEAEMVNAAKRAEAHDFIMGLRDNKGRTGYDAHLGERGVKLSGGQRQRIALARALLKDAPILVLDEATSALDSEVEAQIQHALHAAMDGKTVIAIAHRLSTLADMDRIIVLDDGRIVEIGTHDELLTQDGLYARYWNRQSGGFIGADAQ